ncbi:hypothetical protein GCM10009616_36060 [Microlunatus lacustris]
MTINQHPDGLDDATLDRLATVTSLFTCTTAAQLKAAWLQLTEDQRRELRPSRSLASHAWSLIIRDRILTNAGGTR